MKRALIDRFLDAYNNFDVDGMLSVLHPEIEFQNVAGGTVNARASGIREFRKLAERSKALFLSRRQTVRGFSATGDGAVIELAFRGVLAPDPADGTERGRVLELEGRSEFLFRDGLIRRITDIG